jgi:hexosaminidase
LFGWHFLQDILTEVAELFPDSYFHVGADELNFDCWKHGEAKVADWAKKNNLRLEDVSSFP